MQFAPPEPSCQLMRLMVFVPPLQPCPLLCGPKRMELRAPPTLLFSRFALLLIFRVKGWWESGHQRGELERWVVAECFTLGGVVGLGDWG